MINGRGQKMTGQVSIDSPIFGTNASNEDLKFKCLLMHCQIRLFTVCFIGFSSKRNKNKKDQQLHLHVGLIGRFQFIRINLKMD